MDINSLLKKEQAEAPKQSAGFMDTNPFADALAGLDVAVSKANSFEGLGAGTYLVNINGANFKINQNGNINVSIEYKVIDGDKTGRKEWQHMTMKFGTEWNARGIGDFATIVAAATGADIVNAKKIVTEEIVKFVQSGAEKSSIEGFKEITGNLTITKNKSTGKDGVEKEFTNYKFAKA